MPNAQHPLDAPRPPRYRYFKGRIFWKTSPKAMQVFFGACFFVLFFCNRNKWNIWNRLEKLWNGIKIKQNWTNIIQNLTLKAPSKICSRRHLFFFLIFQRKQVLIFHVNHLPSIQFTWKIRLVFFEKLKKKKNFKMSSAVVVIGALRVNSLFVLRFYGPVNPMGSCRAWSVYLTTRLLGRLSPLSG